MKSTRNLVKVAKSVAEVQGSVGDSHAPLERSHGSITMATSVPATPPKAKDLGKARGCVFTIHKPDDFLDELRRYCKDECTYAVIGHEVCPTTGRKHIQGYCHWKSPRSLGFFSKTFGDCHVEKPRGTAQQNREYCTKDGKFEEFGSIPVQGHRVDWQQAFDDLKEGTPLVEILEKQPHLLPCQRALREVRNQLLKPVHRNVHVTVLWGDAGVGKSRWAWDKYPDLYTKPSGEWWDGYNGEKVLLLDDFYGWIRYHDLLRVLDRYPTSVPFKGGFVWAQWDTIVITSNKHPSLWYADRWSYALRRRLHKIIHVQVLDDGTTLHEEETYPTTEALWDA